MKKMIKKRMNIMMKNLKMMQMGLINFYKEQMLKVFHNKKRIKYILLNYKLNYNT